MNKASLRNFLGNLPLAAELDWSLRQKNRARKDHYNLERLQKALPAAALQAIPYAQAAPAGKKILFFATLHYWIEQSAFMSLLLAGLGHKVTLMTLPYSEWHKRLDKLTQRQRLFHALHRFVQDIALQDVAAVREDRDPRVVQCLLEIIEAAASEVVVDDNPPDRGLQQLVNHVAADESGATDYKNTRSVEIHLWRALLA